MLLIPEFPVGIRRSIRQLTPDRAVRTVRRVLRGATAPQRAGRAAADRLICRRAVARARVELRDPRLTLLPIEVSGRGVLGHVVEEFHAGSVVAAQAGLVADALEARGVSYFFLPRGDQRRTIVVSENDRAAAISAVQQELARTATYLGRPAGTYLQRTQLVGRSWPKQPAVRIFRYLVTPRGEYIGGPDLGCDVQFWEVVAEQTRLNVSGECLPRGTLVGERNRDPVPEFVYPHEQSLVLRPVDGAPRPVLADLATPHAFQVSLPIDAVYTYVDGSDPNWRARMAAARKELGQARLHELAASDSRYLSHDELKYSLRSLDMFADWINHIYIVTDDQVPDWLRTEHPRLTVVNHRDIFGDRGRLPTFNSHAIESQLHRIDGLAENYLYFNDDVFLGRPVSPSTFVLANGLAKFFLSRASLSPGLARDSELPVTRAAKNNRYLLESKFGRTVTHKFQHVPHSLRRSVMFDLEDAFADEASRTASSPFRMDTDISMSASLGHYFGFLTGRAVEGSLRCLYADIARPDTADRLEKLLRDRNVDVFCLNDHDSSHVDVVQQRLLLESFLGRYFPLPSQFEQGA